MNIVVVGLAPFPNSTYKYSPSLKVGASSTMFVVVRSLSYLEIQTKLIINSSFLTTTIQVYTIMFIISVVLA